MPFAARGVGAELATPESRHRETAPPGRFDRESVASLTTIEINDLACQDLVDVVRAAHLPFLGMEVQGRLEFQDRQVLQRLAFLARECCRKTQRQIQRESLDPDLCE